MQCDRTGEVLGAYLDHELDPAMRREVAMHLASCPDCSAMATEMQSTGVQVAALGRERAPAHLATAVRDKLAEAAAGARAPLRLAAGERSLMGGWLARAAALLLVCALTSAATVFVVSRMDDRALLERDVFAAHVRSLLQDNPTQVASSDTHTIKPWFAGRLEYSPTVRDLAAEGFPLAGARLDYVGERRVAALAYRRRLHVISVFLWPSKDAVERAPRALAYRGYNLLTWSRGGTAYWAISDLNMDELRQLQALL
jgi:anti-sigma factor RsiW